MEKPPATAAHRKIPVAEREGYQKGGCGSMCPHSDVLCVNSHAQRCREMKAHITAGHIAPTGLTSKISSQPHSDPIQTPVGGSVKPCSHQRKHCRVKACISPTSLRHARNCSVARASRSFVPVTPFKNRIVCTLPRKAPQPRKRRTVTKTSRSESARECARGAEPANIAGRKQVRVRKN